MPIVKLYFPLGVCLLLLNVACHSKACNTLMDPGIRHTNGMPIASSEPLRAGSTSWNCNPDKLGYCGGVYYWPCVDSLRFSRLKAAHQGCYTPPQHTYDWFAGRICPPREMDGMIEGIEPPGFTNLGELPNDMLMGSGGASLPGGAAQRPPVRVGR